MSVAYKHVTEYLFNGNIKTRLEVTNALTRRLINDKFVPHSYIENCVALLSIEEVTSLHSKWCGEDI
jgi:hypothetical protein